MVLDICVHLKSLPEIFTVCLTVLGICAHLKSLPEIFKVYLTVLGICVHLKSLPDNNLKEGRLPPSLSAPLGTHMLKVFRIYLLIHQLDGCMDQLTNRKTAG